MLTELEAQEQQGADMDTEGPAAEGGAGGPVVFTTGEEADPPASLDELDAELGGGGGKSWVAPAPLGQSSKSNTKGGGSER